MIEAYILRVQYTPKLRKWWMWPDTACDVNQIIKSNTSLKKTMLLFNDIFNPGKENIYRFTKYSGMCSPAEAAMAFTDTIIKNEKKE